MRHLSWLGLAPTFILAFVANSLWAQPQTLPPLPIPQYRPTTLSELLDRLTQLQPRDVRAQTVLSAKTPEAKGNTKEAPSSSRGPLTNESLFEMLTNLGLKPIVNRHDKNYFHIQLSDGFEFLLRVSPDKSEIWFLAGLVEISRPADVPASALLQLFVDQDSLRNTFYQYDRPNKILALFSSLDNRDVSPPVLSKAVDTFNKSLHATSPHWRSEVLQPRRVVDSPAAKVSRQKLQGTWTGVSRTHDGKKNELHRHQLKVAGTLITFLFENGRTAFPATLVFPDKLEATACDLVYSDEMIEKCLFKIDQATLTLCIGAAQQGRPKSFTAPAGSGNELLVYKKES